MSLAFARIGLGICYDVRFPELAAVSARQGCQVCIYPGAFNTTTGPLHWELLQRARYVCPCIGNVTSANGYDQGFG